MMPKYNADKPEKRFLSFLPWFNLQFTLKYHMQSRKTNKEYKEYHIINKSLKILILNLKPNSIFFSSRELHQQMPHESKLRFMGQMSPAVSFCVAHKSL